MFRTKATAAALVAALGLGTFAAAPAQADQRDFARFVVGAAAIAAIAAAVNAENNRKRERQHAYVVPPVRHDRWERQAERRHREWLREQRRRAEWRAERRREQQRREAWLRAHRHHDRDYYRHIRDDD